MAKEMGLFRKRTAPETHDVCQSFIQSVSRSVSQSVSQRCDEVVRSQAQGCFIPCVSTGNKFETSVLAYSDHIQHICTTTHSSPHCLLYLLMALQLVAFARGLNSTARQMAHHQGVPGLLRPLGHRKRLSPTPLHYSSNKP